MRDDSLILPSLSVEVKWKPFFLNLNVPPEGEDLMQHLVAKYGRQAVERFSAPNNPLDAAADRVNIKFNRARRVINTMDGHRLVEWCSEQFPERVDELMESMFHAYFENARDLSKHEELMQVTDGMSIDRDTVRAILMSDAYRESVLRFDRDIKRRVNGVPHFIIEDPRFPRQKPVTLSGGQPWEVFKELLSDIREAEAT